MATLHKIIFLKRDPTDKSIVSELGVEEAVQYLLVHNFCNLHQLVKDNRKVALMTNFFRRLFEQTDVYFVNTTQTPQQTQNEIRSFFPSKNSFT